MCRSHTISMLLLTTFCCLFSLPSNADVIVQKGPSHNGVELFAYKTAAQDAGVIVTLEFRCNKNHGGSSNGAAFIQMASAETGEYKELEVKCRAEGGADGATQSSIERKGAFFQKTKTVIIIAQVDHWDTDRFKEWQNNIENVVKERISNLVKSATDPKTLLELAKSAGFSGKSL